ncbi:uncharacterized protein EI90DRAFT_1305955 [Cantharellus anzutake]|uniref:uncharacterized protein n=1 Tax=Cantharellus anzutake TaxID=1750568 RepID=UPI0019043285|nr:uncharacterized protein EI90DRAFT_1305955 [Cantharellus anzutake]KAF8342146.1 hypothetical protein EI90DRAFT_1305955 [Cantharellus anzutake]
MGRSVPAARFERRRSWYFHRIVTRDSFHDDEPGELYAFDIDVGEAEVNRQFTRYSVDATHCGNWTRFINHSCDPNILVYSAAVEVPPSMGLSRIVFAACRDIPPMQEFSFDYSPAAQHMIDRHSHTSNHDKIPCRCGTSSCRGFLFN